MEEIWKPCPNYPGYMASNLGNVKSLNYMGKGYEKNLHPNPIRGYLAVHLPNKADNRPENLEWVTTAENNRHGTRLQRVSETNLRNHKTGKPVRCIETQEVFDSTHDAARNVGGDQSRICAICNGKGNTAYGYHWEYAETKEG